MLGALQVVFALKDVVGVFAYFEPTLGFFRFELFYARRLEYLRSCW